MIWKHTRTKMETPCKWKYNDLMEWKTWWQKVNLLVLSNFFFRRHVFKMLSAAEASKSLYMREKVKKNLSEKILLSTYNKGYCYQVLWLSFWKILIRPCGDAKSRMWCCSGSFRIELPFPICRCISTHLKMQTFENIPDIFTSNR